MKKSRVVAIVIGSLLGIALIVGGFLFMQGFTRATSEKPENVTISDITDTSAKISWTTGNDTSGAVVQYGSSPTTLTSFAPSDSPRGRSHSVVITLLSTETTYYFQIMLGTSTKFDNAGVPWTFTTKSKDETTVETIASPTPTSKPKPTTTLDRGNTCKETDCEAIKAALGDECSTQEYIRCIKAEQNPSPSN